MDTRRRRRKVHLVVSQPGQQGAVCREQQCSYLQANPALESDNCCAACEHVIRTGCHCCCTVLPQHLQVCFGSAVNNAVLVAVHYLLVLLGHELQDEVLPPRQLRELPVWP